MSGFLYHRPINYENIYQLQSSFEVTTTHTVFNIPISGNIGDRFRFFCPFNPSNSDGINFVVNINNNQLFAFYSIILASSNETGFYFEIQIVDSSEISYYATIERNQTAPEIQGGQTAVVGSVYNFDCEIGLYSDSLNLGTIYTFTIDKIGKVL